MAHYSGEEKCFDDAKDFGSWVDEAGLDVFVHYSSIVSEGCKSL